MKIKYRNMWLQLILTIITFGFYGIYWFYQSGVELKYFSRDEYASPGLWTVFLFIPFANLYAYYKYSELFSRVSTERLNPWIVFILFIFFCPAVWFLVQKDLNRWALSIPEVC